MGQKEMAQMIVDGLRPQTGRHIGSGFQDPGDDADVEEVYSRPTTRNRGRPNRRTPWENILSVSLVFFRSQLGSKKPATDPQPHEKAHYSGQLAGEHSHRGRSNRVQPRSWSKL